MLCPIILRERICHTGTTEQAHQAQMDVAGITRHLDS
jgi:hypothetical protein